MAVVHQTRHMPHEDNTQFDGLPHMRWLTQDVVAYFGITVVELRNARDFDNPWFTQNVSQSVRVDVQGIIKYGLEGFIGNYRTHAADSQTFQCVIGNVTALVDEKIGTATAILSQYLSGFQGDERKRAGTTLMSWLFDCELRRWICQSVTMMLGTPVFLKNGIYGVT